jgi:hypothetical protein
MHIPLQVSRRCLNRDNIAVIDQCVVDHEYAGKVGSRTLLKLFLLNIMSPRKSKKVQELPATTVLIELIHFIQLVQEKS